MANANLPKPTNGVGPHLGDLSPDDAERFAAAFKPMWELDDAPFAATPADMSASEVRQLGTVNGNADLMAAMHAPILAPAAPAMAKARPQRPPAPRAAAAVPQRATGRDASVDLDLPPIRKSNKGILLAVGGLVAGAALFFGVRAALSGPETPTPAATATASPASHEEPKIPPPPAPDPPAAMTAPPAQDPPKAADPPKPEPPKA